ncbi:hypothetical protein B2J86_14920 [Acidovorax sp. SRB_14]|uniref:GntR family transcriptional regulator n=1 Tax=Acidovorax sp. SRB_14 TaxID=1962699 RepID=UPI00156669AE|nr:GntR family transcriptional regulator [Acidovorax sp. SRB_14]NMM82204.1 hypothetical protein [Acidovorax sp. SRB_14]
MTIENIDLTARVFTHIRDAITAGKYEQGTPMKLPQLSKELGVSQTPIREALIRLAEKEYLEKAGSRSYVIRAVSKQQYFKLSEIRAELEASIIQQILKEELPFNLSGWQDIYDLQAEAMESGDYEQGLILNRNFHGYYLSQSNIPQVAEFVENICVIAGPILHSLKGNRFTTDKEKHFHAHMLKAFEKRDPVMAADAVRSDIMVNAERICSLMRH